MATGQNLLSPRAPSATRRLDATKRRSIISLLAIAAAAAIVIVWALWSGNPVSGTPRYESAKTAMQVIAVVVLGGFVAIVTFAFNDTRTQEAKLRDQRREKIFREREDLRDKRARQDALFRSMLQETLTAYHLVKRVRRMLAAETGGEDGRRITVDVYDTHMDALNDQQLMFEQFKRLAPLADKEQLSLIADTRTGVTSVVKVELEPIYDGIEKYLNSVIDEYKEKRHMVAGQAAGFPLEQLGVLNGFLSKEKFKPGVSHRFGEIIETLQAALLQPLVLPEPDEGDN